MLEGYVMIAAIYSWFTWSKIQRKMNVTVFTSVNQYIIGKMLLCLFTGWFIMPIDIFIKIISKSTDNKKA